MTALPALAASWSAVAPAASWWSVAPQVVLAALALCLPGAVVARMAGARGLVAAAVAPILTLGMLALLVLVQVPLSPRFGLWWPRSVLLGLVLLVLLAVVVHLLVGWRVVPDRTPDARPRERRADALPAAVGALASGAVLLHATGAAGTPEQSNDSPFHLSAIARVADEGDGSWQVVRAVTGHRGFYPPLFDDTAALLVRTLHLDVVAASNVLLLLVVALVWPLGVDALVRTVLTAGRVDGPRWRPERVARAAAMLLVPATAVFPAQLLQFGALWPNLLGIAVIPAVIAALVDLTYPAGRVGQRASLWTPALDWTVLVLGGAALLLAHPDSLLSFVVLGSGLLVAGPWRWARRQWAAGRRGVVAALALATVVLAAGAVVLLARSSLLHTVSGFSAHRPWTVREALLRVVGGDLVTGIRRPLAGTLALVGIGACLVRRRHRWLVLGWVLAAAQVVLAASVQAPVTALLTGAWYTEPARLSSALLVATMALAGVGAVTVVVGVARVSRTGLRRVLAGVLAVVVLGWLGVGVRDVHTIARDTYQGLGPDRSLVTPAEAALYARVLRAGGTGAEVRLPTSGVDAHGVPYASPGVIGDPFGGAMFAALYSGRPTPVRHFGQALGGTAGSVAGDTGILAAHLRELATTPAVCAAARRLHVGYVVEDTHPIWTEDPRAASYRGLRHLGGVRGLDLVARDDGVSVYRLTACLTSPAR